MLKYRDETLKMLFEDKIVCLFLTLLYVYLNDR
jgi:hypothetical protein